jgi:hypothetical protein
VEEQENKSLAVANDDNKSICEHFMCSNTLPVPCQSMLMFPNECKKIPIISYKIWMNGKKSVLNQ